VDGLREAGERGDALFGTVDSYLIWKLTGGRTHATDVSNASRTLLMNLESLQWDEEILEITGIPLTMLPSIQPSSGTIDSVSDDSDTHLGGVPISGVLGDQQAALFGQACFEPGQVKSTYGTGCFLLMNTGSKSVPSSSGLLTTVAYQMGGGAAPVYALEGSVAYSGSTIQWLRDNLQVVASAHECEKMAAEVFNVLKRLWIICFLSKQ
jgi:glycerol kinase